MDSTTLLVAALALLLGLVLGWLLALRPGRSVPEVEQLRDAVAAQESARREAALTRLVGPLADGLDRLGGQLARLDADRAHTQATLAEQIAGVARASESLRRETATLVTALRAPHVRGRWGETQLQRTVEAAGMVKHVDFDLQVTSTDGVTSLRPDMVVRLVGGKQVVVDAKVAFSAYLEAMEARDDAHRDERLRAHARQLRTHVEVLASRGYQHRFTPTPEFVVCFVPADAFLDAALQADPTLQEHAFGRGIVLATPSTLVALLRTVAYTWRQDALAANARQVHELGRDLYQRLGTLGGHVDKLGRGLTTAVEQYNKTVASLESRVLVTARRLRELEVVDSSDPTTVLPAPAQVEVVTRAVDASELAAGP